MITVIMRNKRKDSEVILKDFERESIRKAVTPSEIQEGNQVFREITSLDSDVLSWLPR